MKIWSKNLNDVQAIENYDVMILHLYKSCHWDERRLRNKKKNPIIDKGYIKPIISSIEVEVRRVPDNTYRFINI